MLLGGSRAWAVLLIIIIIIHVSLPLGPRGLGLYRQSQKRCLFCHSRCPSTAAPPGGRRLPGAVRPTSQRAVLLTRPQGLPRSRDARWQLHPCGIPPTHCQTLHVCRIVSPPAAFVILSDPTYLPHCQIPTHAILSDTQIGMCGAPNTVNNKGMDPESQSPSGQGTRP
jgi:hypothetical protein